MVCAETYADFQQLGRFTIRDEGKIINNYYFILIFVLYYIIKLIYNNNIYYLNINVLIYNSIDSNL